MESEKIGSKPKQIIPFKTSEEFARDAGKNNSYVNNIFTINNLILGLFICLILHIFFVIVFGSQLSLRTIAFWLFFIVDLILQAIIFIPIIAIIRRQIPWYDPICLLAFLFLVMTMGIFPVYLADPTYYISFITIGGIANLNVRSETDFFLASIWAEIILIIFIVIVYFINRKVIKVAPVKIDPRETKFILFSTFVLFIISAFFFTRLWSFQNYLTAATVDIGSLSVKSPAIGTAYRYILADIGIPTLSLGMITLLVTKSVKRKVPRLLLVSSVTLLCLIPIFIGGSRITLFSTVYVIFAVIAWFGIKLDRAVWFLMGIATILLIVSVTVLRGNQLLSRQPEIVLDQLISGKAISLYNQTANQSFMERNIVNVDRVGAVILVSEFIDNGKSMMYGESLVAGLLNTFYQIGKRIGLIDRPGSPPFIWATDQIMTWVFGFKPPYLGTHPPSIPGEFYMQGGLIGEILLSILFGSLILWLRRNCAKTGSLVARWVFVYITLQLIILIPTEISGISERLVFYLPVWLCIVIGAKIYSRARRRSYV